MLYLHIGLQVLIKSLLLEEISSNLGIVVNQYENILVVS